MDADTGETRWAAVIARDAGQDGGFVYSVRTTGVFCRPSCAARRPNRENVRFHASAAEAQAAGFRPCLRCRPERAAEDHPHSRRVASACRAIEAAEGPVALAALAETAGLSPFHFQRVFKAETGVTPRAYAAALRDGRVRAALTQSASVTEAIYEAGYGSSGRFYARSAAVLGMAPAAWRGGGKRETIRYALGQCSLGAILVAQSGAGICSILLGDDPDQLAADLRQIFPRADLAGAAASFAETVAAVVRVVDEPTTGLSLPLDIRGTSFQRRVWEALRAIPPGSTATYTEIAARIGRPGSVRAVAGACAANVLAVAIPCHRVKRRDGSLSGYRWSVERKRALLAGEGE